MMLRSPVTAIPPSYLQDQSLDISTILNYIKYLEKAGAKCLMTTAGTSQFNLLDTPEIISFNEAVSTFNGKHILGIPPVNTKNAVLFVQNSKYFLNNSTSYLALYPERYYNNASIINYIKEICEVTNKPIYLHANKIKNGIQGDWEYHSDLINNLYDSKLICGIKEEYSNLQDSFNFINALHTNLDVIVAGGSMRRFLYLEPAGANSFLSGLGNIMPQYEVDFMNTEQTTIKQKLVKIETEFFNVMMSYGWHRSLREALKQTGLSCFFNRQPWPMPSKQMTSDIAQIIQRIISYGKINYE